MGVNDSIFESNNIGKTLFKLAVPLVLSLLVAELYNLVDTIFVGRYVGPNAIGALTIAFPIQRLLISVGILIAVGTSTFISRSLGERNYNNVKKGILSSISLTIVAIIAISILIYIFRKPIIYKLGASDILYPLAEEYISIILLGALFQSLTVVFSYILTSLGNTKIGLYANMIGAMINLIIDFILVAHFDIGIRGAAIATSLSQLLGFVYAYYAFKKVEKNLNFKFSFTLNLSLIWIIVSVGFSSFIVEFSDAINAGLLNNLLHASGGDEAVIIIGVVTKLSMFMYITIIGISIAMQPIIAYNYGAGNYTKMKKALKVAIIAVMGTSIIFWLGFLVFATPIIGFFLKEQALLPRAVKAFRLCISLLPSVGIYYITIYYHQALGESTKSFLLSIYRQIIVFIPIAILLIGKLGVLGAWIAYPLSDIISAVTSIYFIKKAQKFDFQDNESLDRKCNSLVNF
ncbi:MATE family efflux transporter [Clostridium tetani]|uniref:Multidrug export protein MepA n=1 Tax=Clostridium tetani TaxID=1513 RepID=A0ABY0EKL8_CLOTA|nr:MATE family efflux transporter [Clostridium tetani]KHO39241.1 multidrug transporter MatE [Clostridium tetani]RXI51682.1 MATE family efflux transporter [Clostridium tetani]RXI74093.1 MATE family efflux transporter [Clostridium tetani]CDI49470.1 Na+ driven multidrug efflux pump [Clostridium tetani 12124569]